MMDWFRSHHGAPTDPKWRTIAKRARVAPAIVVSLAWALLDVASQSADRGSMASADPETLADFMGCEVDEVERVIAAMVDKGVLAGDRFTAWERRQVKREDGSAERSKDRRERLKAEHAAHSVRSNAVEIHEAAERPQATASDRIEPLEQSREEQNREEAGKPASAQAREPAAGLPAIVDQEFEAACRHAVVGWDQPKGSFKPMLALEGDREAIVAVLREVAASKRSPVGSWKLWAEDIVPERLAAKRASRPATRAPSPAAPVDDSPRVNTPSGPRSLAFLRTEHEAGRWSKLYGPRPGQPGCPLDDFALEPAE